MVSIRNNSRSMSNCFELIKTITNSVLLEMFLIADWSFFVLTTQTPNDNDNDGDEQQDPNHNEKNDPPCPGD